MISVFRERSAARVIKFLMRVTKETLILDEDASTNGLNYIKVQRIKESHRDQLTQFNAVMSIFSGFYDMLSFYRHCILYDRFQHFFCTYLLSCIFSSRVSAGCNTLFPWEVHWMVNLCVSLRPGFSL